MNSDVCTLFEGDYQLGVAALVNSLVAHGFRGTVWAGYRGALPHWAAPLSTGESGFSDYAVKGGGTIRFVPLTTTAHLTNYKADFMIDVLTRIAPQLGGLFYFDPDIVVSGRWSFYEEWIENGVALCEDIASPMCETHPTRGTWRRIAAAAGVPMHARTDSYVNGGFVGVTRAQLPFLEAWKRTLAIIRNHIGGDGNFNWTDADRTHPFYRNDQDALNMAIEACDVAVSIVGKDGMAISGGGYIMYHALGSPKPWRKKPILQALKGWPPTAADVAFLQWSEGAIAGYSAAELARIRRSTRVAAAICRFVRKRGW